MIDAPLLEIEPDDPETPAPALEIEPDDESGQEPAEVPAAVVDLSLMTVLPADFPLPTLIKFCPRAELKIAAEQAARYALSVDVAGPEGLQRADVALTTLRTSQKAIEEHFAEPADIANRLHKGITSTRAEWLQPGKAALETVGRKVATEQRRLEDLEREQRRRDQAEADRRERERARREAEEAAKAQAPAPVVEELKRQAEVATAPPVAPAVQTPVMRGSSVVATWKARIAGTPADADPNPESNALTPAQHLEVLKLLKAVVDGRAPITAVELNWKYLNARAKADKSTLSIPGIEAYEDLGVRSKGTRGRA